MGVVNAETYNVAITAIPRLMIEQWYGKYLGACQQHNAGLARVAHNVIDSLLQACDVAQQSHLYRKGNGSILVLNY